VASQNRLTKVVLGGRTFTFRYAELMPPHDPDEMLNLRRDIAARGVLTPILVTEDGVVIDGHTRLLIARDLGLTDVPIVVKVGLTEEEARQLAVVLNVHRRHLDREQRRELIASLLKVDPTRSNAAIGADAKADRKTVEAVLQKLEGTGDIPELGVTRGKDGKDRPRRNNNTTPAGKAAPAPAAPAPEAVAPDTPSPDTDGQIEAAVQKPGLSGALVDEAMAKRRANDRLWEIGSAIEHLGVEIQGVSEEDKDNRSRPQLRQFLKQLRGEVKKLSAWIES